MFWVKVLSSVYIKQINVESLRLGMYVLKAFGNSKVLTKRLLLNNLS